MNVFFQYQFKFCLATAGIEFSGPVKSDDKKIDLWMNGCNEVYTLEAKTKQAKENFALELRKVIQRQKELVKIVHRGMNGAQQNVRLSGDFLFSELESLIFLIPDIL
jgi:hypothetical protein